MAHYYCKAEKGTTPPKHVHYDLDLAVAEAKRLCEKLNCPIEILECIGNVRPVEVPVTKTEIRTTLFKKDDLPF